MNRKFSWRKGRFNATSGWYANLKGALLQRLSGDDLVIFNMHWNENGELDINKSAHIFTANSDLPPQISDPILRFIQSQIKDKK